jgi:IPT/TIG domain/Divergent InlB B-repeat domain
MTAARLRPRLAISGFIAAVIALTFALPAVASAAEVPLTVEFFGTGAGSVECEVEAIVEPCAPEYEEGKEVTVLPEAEEGSEFTEFFGDCGPLACELTMDEAHTVNVVFDLEPAEELALNIVEPGTGEGSVECEVEATTGPCEAEYPEGTDVTLIATAETGSKFEEWSGECDTIVGNECGVEMTEEKTVEVVFDVEPEEFALNIEEPGSGSGTVECELQEGPEACAAEYPEGTELTLIATAESGSEFVEWNGECDSIAGNECAVEMTAEKTVEAIFELEESGESLLTIHKAGTGAGKVECEVEGGEPEACESKYAEGTELSLVATASGGSNFAGFSGGTGSAAGCSTSPCTFMLNANSAVTATFNLSTPAPTVSSVAPNKGTTAGGTVVTITGTNLTGAEEVKYGATAVTCAGTVATCKVESATEIKATTPAHAAGEVDVTVKTPGGTSATGAGDKFTFETPVSAPTVSSVAPNKGTTAGGTVVTITGTNLTGATAVKFGATAAASFEVKGATEVKATSPAHAAGQVDVTVTTPGGTSTTGAGDKFTFETPVVKFKLTVSKSGTGSGTVTSTPSGINCGTGSGCEAEFESGKEVELSQSAASGSEFKEWTGACTGSGACKVTMSAAKSVGAVFNTKSSGGGGGSSGGGTPPPPPPPAGTASAAGTATVASGKAAIKLTCSGGPCSGSFTLTAKIKQGKKTKNLTIGKASFSLAVGASSTLSVKLSGPAKQELAKGKTVKAKLSGTGITAATVKLKQAKKK